MNQVQNGFVKKLSPPQVLVIGFAATILAGAFLLSLPISTENGQPLPFIDALFTATSAVCLTGLVVVDTATTFSTFGEMVIMILFQVGGIGIMTFATFFALLVGKKIGIRERLILREAFNKIDMQGVVRLVLAVVIMTLVIEGVGFIILSLRFIPEWGWGKGLYYAMFHSVSAFNNAGFDLFGDYEKFSSLVRYVGDPVVNLTIGGLFTLGGLGFIVILELVEYRVTKRLSLHTKLVLTMTGILIFVGMVVILAIEWRNPATLGNLPWYDKLLASFFHSLTPRSAGFNTLSLADMYPATLFFTLFLMFVGASPSSTGGGIKTTTLATILLAVWGMIRGRENVVTFRRRIPYNQVYKALTVTVASITVVLIVTMLLTITENPNNILTAMFETVSAFGTCGLSMGLTSELSLEGKILITITMFAGRLGPLTIAMALARSLKQPPYRYPEERPLIG
ncbi:TrkH family potassium uptake protein [Paenactinomyces guangxiensis]|uniref:Trk family potassium uptake protein n=1 Tax=Paenactinomyces guangxiensis TaxID=1490290 RepID=A0A7W2A730_9BACL|nr:TrkH family potassium uptake protein [Paenactinomyces guangxiensis]MBA4492724.1 Trk family potassium uptake protein [Paenactinomyces guangxiensis]MBH8590427.1 Trk family potassium uptake protein [Paenactinomyces guangxiensis]